MLEFFITVRVFWFKFKLSCLLFLILHVSYFRHIQGTLYEHYYVLMFTSLFLWFSGFIWFLLVRFGHNFWVVSFLPCVLFCILFHMIRILMFSHLIMRFSGFVDGLGCWDVERGLSYTFSFIIPKTSLLLFLHLTFSLHTFYI